MSCLSRSTAVLAVGLAFAWAAPSDTAVAAQSGPRASPTLAQVTSGASAPTSQSAQRELHLSAAQKKKIVADLAIESTEPAAAEVQASVGTKIPSSVALHPLPTTVATDVPAARNYSYAKLHDDSIVIVDPKGRVVADVIPAKPSTTGSGSGQ